MIKAVIWDMDGVIIDSEPVYLQNVLKFAQEKNPAVTIEQLYGMVGATKKDNWTVCTNAIGNGQTWEEIREEYRSRNYNAGVDYQKIFRPEVTEILEELHRRGYRVALASSTRLELVEHILKLNGIYDQFEVVVSGNQFARSKPDPEIYHHTAKLLGLKEEECMAVEDSTVGITAGKAAGMTVAAIIDERFGFDQSLADYRIYRLKEIMNILN